MPVHFALQQLLVIYFTDDILVAKRFRNINLMNIMRKVDFCFVGP